MTVEICLIRVGETHSNNKVPILQNECNYTAYYYYRYYRLRNLNLVRYSLFSDHSAVVKSIVLRIDVFQQPSPRANGCLYEY